MKIALSAKGDSRGRHVVLICKRDEVGMVQNIINREILEGKARLVKEDAPHGSVYCRMNLRYLDALSLAFPDAELSPGILHNLVRAEEKRLAGMEIPKIRIPGFIGKLYNFQKIAAQMIVDGDIDLLNDEMGLGKSFSSAAAVRKLEAFPCLIVCPNSVKYTWAEVLEEYFDVEVVVVDGNKTDRDLQIRKEADFTIVNWEAIRAKPVRASDSRYSRIVDWEHANPALFEREWSFLICDEYHRAKNPSSQTTRGFFQLQADRELHMSGTPILNRPEEGFPVLHRLYPDQFPNYDLFVQSIAVREGPYRTVVAYRPKPMAELRDFMQNISLRRRKEQVLNQLPKVVRSIRHVDLTTEQRRLYNKIRDEGLLLLDDGEVQNIKGILPLIIRLKQACFSPELYGGSPHSAKITEVKEIVEELISAGHKAILFSQWSRATEILQRELKQFNPAYVTGDVRLKDRQTQYKRFNNDPDCHLYIGTIAANREGINLGVATYVIFTDLGWTPAEHDQAIGRSAAGGLRGIAAKGKTVNVIEIQARDTFEERIVALLKRKKALFDRMIERDGGSQIKTVTLKEIRDIL